MFDFDLWLQLALYLIVQVKTGINRSLHDESISVREAAVDLLGRHIGTDVDLAMAFFDLIGQVMRVSFLVSAHGFTKCLFLLFRLQLIQGRPYGKEL